MHLSKNLQITLQNLQHELTGRFAENIVKFGACPSCHQKQWEQGPLTLSAILHAQGFDVEYGPFVVHTRISCKQCSCTLIFDVGILDLKDSENSFSLFEKEVSNTKRTQC